MQDISLENFAEFESLLSEEEKLIYNTAKNFVNNEVLNIIDEAYDADDFPKHLINRLGELGFLGCTIKGYDCAGINSVSYGLINMALEAADSGLRSFNSVQTSLVMYPIYSFGSEEQKQKYLPKLAKAEMIGCFGLTEPDHGSNPSNMQTRAEKVDGGFKLNGSKMWITNGSIADVAVVWAHYEDQISAFVVDAGTPGFSAKTMEKKRSLRASVTSELIFQDCIIPETNLLPGTSAGLKTALACLNQARLGIAWGAIGVSMACYREALEYAKTRVQFHGKPISSHQLIQKELADMISEICKAQFLTLHYTRLKDQDQIRPEHVSMVKRNNVRTALEIARKAREIMGANGISSEYPIMRHICNLESVLTYEGTENIHTLIIGKAITGINAF